MSAKNIVVIGHYDLSIKRVPLAGSKRRCRINGYLNYFILRMLVAKNQIVLWLIDNILEPGIAKLFHDVPGIFIKRNIRHTDFANSEMGSGDFLIFQTGKLCLMGGKGLPVFLLVRAVYTKKIRAMMSRRMIMLHLRLLAR